MADKTPEQEPSIEEILASIRQIISDDEDKEPTPEPVVEVAPPEPEPVFVPEPAPEPEPEPEDDILELVDAIPEPAPAPRPVEKPTNDSLLSNSARQATISSMAKLAGNVPINRSSSFGSVTLEDIVREMLHPMLRDWMNDNLPPMVERIVQKELEKLARRALDE